MAIAAGLYPFMPSCVQRFLISAPDLRITATQSSWRWRMARLLWPSPQRPSASDSILRCLERKWPACSVCCDDDLPRPTPFFVAAKKVVPPAASVATIIFHVRFNSSMRQRKMVPPADRSNTELQRFLISGGQFGNRCKETLDLS